MLKVTETEMTPCQIEGAKGSIQVYDVIQGEITVGVRVVKTNSDVPKRPHVHSEKQVIYVISGTGKITDGMETFDLEPGDFILLDTNEEHYVITENDDLKVFEVKHP